MWRQRAQNRTGAAASLERMQREHGVGDLAEVTRTQQRLYFERMHTLCLHMYV